MTREGADIDNNLMAVVIGALSGIFILSLFVLLYICIRHRRGWERLDKKSKEPELALALRDIGLGNALEQILNDEHWINDASGLIPQCLAVLRTCQRLTESLSIALSVEPRKGSTHLIEAAKRIPSRVDDVVKSMYPPLDPRLLEARTAALVLAVSNLTLLAQSMSGYGKLNFQWIEQGLNELDGHLAVLRKASNEIEATYMDNKAANSVV